MLTHKTVIFNKNHNHLSSSPSAPRRKLIALSRWGTLMHCWWWSVPLHFEWGQNLSNFYLLQCSWLLSSAKRHWNISKVIHILSLFTTMIDLDCLATKSDRAELVLILWQSGDDFRWIWINFSFGNWASRWQECFRIILLKQTIVEWIGKAAQ